MALPSKKTKPATSRTSSPSKRTSAPKTPTSPKKKTSPKSGATHTTKKAPRKASAAKKRTTRAVGKTGAAGGKPPIEHRKVGRPPINDPNDVEAIEDRITEYFDSGVKPTFCGLALALGYTTRQQLWEHGRGEEPISIPIKVAMLMIEATYEGNLTSPKCTGAIFALKNRGWKDTQTIEDERPTQTHVYLPENNRGRS